jgi:hypothetical protein
MAPPDLASTPQVHILAWQAWAPAAEPGTSAGPESLVAACFTGETGWWTPEAEPVVLDRLGAVVSSTAVRVAGVGARRVASSEHVGASTREHIVGAGEAEGRLVARTFLGFVDAGDGSAGPLVGCFALCATDRTDLAACAPSVEEATIVASFVPAPQPTLAVRAIVAMAHHPSVTAASALTFSILAGVVALVTRRRPRTK